MYLNKKFIFALIAIGTMLAGMQQPIFAGKFKVDKKIVLKKGERKVLYAEGDDGDEKLASASKNYQLAMQMLKDAMEAGHVVKDKNGMYVKKCGKECTCLPIMPSAVTK